MLDTYVLIFAGRDFKMGKTIRAKKTKNFAGRRKGRSSKKDRGKNKQAREGRW